MRHNKLISKTPVQTTIENFSHDGRGIARIEGKTTFIQGALPGEAVRFEYLRRKKDYDEGIALSIDNPSAHRVTPRCPHVTLCGGCSLQHIHEQEQIHIKQDLLLNLLTRIGHVEPENILPPLKSFPWHYRNKARLSVRYVEKKQSVLVGFREKNNPRFITEITQCSILNNRVQEQLVPLRNWVASLSDPRSIAQIEVAAGDDEVALIFRNLHSLSEQDQASLIDFAKKTAFKIFLQPGGEDSVHLFYPPHDTPYLQYSLPEESLIFQFFPTDFVQINTELNQKMITHALHLLEVQSHDTVLDLFCGLGNFSLPLAKRAARVLGIEGSDKMVMRAKMNALNNGLPHVDFSSADLSKPDALASFKKNQFSVVVLDPPRTGAFEVVKNIQQISPRKILYISCNPATLARDAEILVHQQGYYLKAAGVMDMFPHTAHVESIALFEKR